MLRALEPTRAIDTAVRDDLPVVGRHHQDKALDPIATRATGGQLCAFGPSRRVRLGISRLALVNMTTFAAPDRAATDPAVRPVPDKLKRQSRPRPRRKPVSPGLAAVVSSFWILTRSIRVPAGCDRADQKAHALARLASMSRSEPPSPAISASRRHPVPPTNRPATAAMARVVGTGCYPNPPPGH
jgi:hypothetical protein